MHGLSFSFLFSVVSFASLVGFFGEVYFSLIAGSGLMRRKRSISERTEPSPSRTRRSSTLSSQRSVSQRWCSWPSARPSIGTLSSPWNRPELFMLGNYVLHPFSIKEKLVLGILIDLLHLPYPLEFLVFDRYRTRTNGPHWINIQFSSFCTSAFEIKTE